MTAPAQAALFTVEAEPAAPVSGAPAGRYGPAAYDAALTGDGYGWLADLLAAPQPPACERCGQPMSLPAAAPVLWACPACQPGEAA
jgi:ribosomal protein L37AE/L43A